MTQNLGTIVSYTVCWGLLQYVIVQTQWVIFTDEESAVSFYSELPQPLQQAMVSFIERCPNWDQYRLVQAGLAGFLIQHGVESREITRLYVGNMFRRESLTQGV